MKSFHLQKYGWISKYGYSLSEINQRKTNTIRTQLYVESKKQTERTNKTNSQIQRIGKWSAEGWEFGWMDKMGEGDQEVQTSSYKINVMDGNSLTLQWLSLPWVQGSILGEGTKIPRAMQHSLNK